MYCTLVRFIPSIILLYLNDFNWFHLYFYKVYQPYSPSFTLSFTLFSLHKSYKIWHTHFGTLICFLEYYSIILTCLHFHQHSHSNPNATFSEKTYPYSPLGVNSELWNPIAFYSDCTYHYCLVLGWLIPLSYQEHTVTWKFLIHVCFPLQDCVVRFLAIVATKWTWGSWKALAHIERQSCGQRCLYGASSHPILWTPLPCLSYQGPDPWCSALQKAPLDSLAFLSMSKAEVQLTQRGVKQRLSVF
jgi:hypothetical protein